MRMEDDIAKIIGAIGRRFSLSLPAKRSDEEIRAEARKLLTEHGIDVGENVVIPAHNVISAFYNLEMCGTSCPGLDKCKLHGYSPCFQEHNGVLHVNVEECSRRLQRKYEKAKEMLPARYRDKYFETFSLDSRSSSVEAAFLIAKRASEQGGSLILSGGVGTGKTHLACAMALDAIDKGRSVEFRTATDLRRRLKSFGDDGEYEAVLDRCCSCSLFILDDVGTEKITEWGAEQVYAIINARYNDVLQTVITTNITTPDDLAAHMEPMGERIISRLSQMCLWVRIEDSDQRQRPSPR